MAFKDRLAYRGEYFLGIVGYLLIMVAQLFLWKALLGQSQQAVTNAGVITLREMSTYVFVSITITIFVRPWVINIMSDRIRNGQILMDLVKPVNFKTYLFCDMIGRTIFNFLFQLLPVLILCLIFIGINYPSLPNFLLFVLAMINAIIIMFLMTFSAGLSAFWYTSVWQIQVLIWTLVAFFSGMFIPLWFFPKTLADISSVLPFRLIYYVPLSIFLGKVEFVDCLYLLLQQFIWVAVFYGLSRLIWHTAIKKLVIQGG